MGVEESQVEAVFYAALERSSLVERAAYLDKACAADAELRERVERLLDARPKLGRFLEHEDASLLATGDLPSLDEHPGATIGHYKLIEQIGEGGMGAVYLADQAEPVRRKVALKIIKPGMDSREVIARFEAERQALALMNHPHIATVLDAGATAAGRPYFVMELVKGVPITEFCDQQQLRTRERLPLFVTVCQAIQHAHQKGVIHRDIKPGNVLVEVHDVAPVPKVIDFGVAKAIGQQLTDKSLHTGFHQMVGTPLYTSPEQAGQSSLDVDTRSDVYSLGVLLYELLTGTTPFERETLRQVGPDEMRRMIREVDPPRPSARVSTLNAESLSTVSARRQVEPHKLSQQLRGDLDWIVMKALEKDRNRRYESASALAADVERYLRDEPVHACPPSTWYRCAKLVRRRRAALVTTGFVALALVTGTAVSVWQAVRATRAERRTTAALATAGDRLQFARQAIDEMYTEVAEKWLAQEAEMTPLQQRFLERALVFYQRLAAERGEDQAVRLETARAQQRVGEIEQKLARHARAEAAYRQAITLFEQLVRESHEQAECSQGLAMARKSLGRLLLHTGRQLDAERELQRALTLIKALAARYPQQRAYQTDLAQCNWVCGDVRNTAGRLAEAEATYRESVTIYEALLKQSPGDRELRFGRAKSLALVNNALNSQTRGKEVEGNIQEVVTAAAALVAEDPKDPEYRQQLATSLTSLGWVQLLLGRLSESEASCRRAVPIAEELARSFPHVVRYRADLSRTLNNFGVTLNRMNKLEECEQIQRRSLEIDERLAAEHPEVPDYRSKLGAILSNLSQSLMRRGAWQEAQALLERAVSEQRAALRINPNQTQYGRFLKTHLRLLVVVRLAIGDQQAATRGAEDYASAVLAKRSPEERAPAAVEVCEDLVTITNDVARRPDSKLREHELATCVLLSQTLIRKALEPKPDALTQHYIADFLSAAPEPMRDPELALTLAKKASELGPDDPLRAQSLGWALYRTGDWKGCIAALKKKTGGGADDFVMAMAYWQLGDKAEAQKIYESASEWLKGYEVRCEERRKLRRVSLPQPSQLRRFQAEAAALLRVQTPTEPAQSVPQGKPSPPEKEAAKEGIKTN